MEDKFFYILVGAIAAFIGFLSKEIITRKLNKKEKIAEHRLILLEKIYSDVGFAIQVSLEENTEKEKMSQEAMGRLGFSLRTYFPDIFNEEYKSLMNDVNSLRVDVILARLQGNFTQPFLSSWQQGTTKISTDSSAIFEKIIVETEKYK